MESLYFHPEEKEDPIPSPLQPSTASEEGLGGKRVSREDDDVNREVTKRQKQ